MRPFALEPLDAFEIWYARGGQIAGGHDAERCGDDIAFVGAYRPDIADGVEVGRSHARVELDVLAQIEPVGDVVDILKDFRLVAVALRPMPFLLQVVVEGVGVFQAFHVAARAGVAVPEPGATYTAAGFEGFRLEAEAAEAMEGVQAAEAAADHDGVEFFRMRADRCRALHDL